MFLTRFTMNPVRRDTRKLSGNPHALHAAVMAAWPPQRHEAAVDEGRVLWRLDRHGTTHLTLYVVSPFEPDLTHLVESCGWPATEGWDTRPYAPLLDRLAAGQHWQFRLTANPVRRVATQRGHRGKVLPHVTAAQQEQWLVERATALGFSLPKDEDGQAQVRVVDRRTVSFPREGATVTLAYATFDGALQVEDPAALRTALVQGVGRAKGYGCGLVTLARSPA